MKIYPVNSMQPQHKTASFGSCSYSYTAKSIKELAPFSKDIIHTTTNLFRNDLSWELLTRYVLRNFADKNKVNTLCLAASDGSEAYSWAISLIEAIPKYMHDKFFPIFASDINDKMVDYAKSGKIDIFDCELTYALYDGFCLADYFKPTQTPPDYFNQYKTYKVLPKLFNAVKFKKSDILSELKALKDDGNTIVFCRNVLPYLNKNYTDELIDTAKEKLKQGSLFIIGNYDNNADVHLKLIQNGFYNPLIGEGNLFKRGEACEITDLLNSGYLY